MTINPKYLILVAIIFIAMISVMGYLWQDGKYYKEEGKRLEKEAKDLRKKANQLERQADISYNLAMDAVTKRDSLILIYNKIKETEIIIYKYEKARSYIINSSMSELDSIITEQLPKNLR